MTVRRYVLWLVAASALIVGGLPTVAYAIPPTNDASVDARTVGALPFRDELDTSDATGGSETGCGIAMRDVWYRFDAAQDMDVAVSTRGSAFDTVLGVTSGSSRVGCNNDAFGQRTSYLRFVAQAGSSYLIQVGGESEPNGGSLVLTMEQLTPPPNDSIGSAEAMTLPFSDEVDVSIATASASDPQCGQKLRTVWYSIAVTASQVPEGESIRISTAGSDYQAHVGVYTGSPSSLTEVVCEPTEVLFKPNVGTTYYVMVSSETIAAGTLRLRASLVEPPKPPPNDGFAQAETELVSALPTNKGPIDATDATTASNDPFCMSNARSIWFALDLEANDLPKGPFVKVDASPSNYATAVSVYTGTQGSLTQVACNPDAPESVIFEATAGRRYYAMVSSAGGPPAGERFLANVAFDNVLPPSVPAELTVKIHDTGFHSVLTGSAALQGELTCTQDAEVRIEARISQRGRDAENTRRIQCDGTEQWSINLFGNFRRGEAFAEVTLSGAGPRGDLIDPVSRSRTVRLIDCTQIGSSGRDALDGTKRDDIICALAGNDRLSGADGNDRLLSGAGDDVVVGGAGDDFLQGAAGADRLVGGPGRDVCFAGDDRGDRYESCERIIHE